MTPTEEDAIPEDNELPLGRIIAGNFRIDRLIGSGAMGHVYQAEQLSLGKTVAVKVLHQHLTTDPKLILRFQREAKSASRLNHPNSIQIIDSGQDASGTLYIAMELLAGRDLAQVIRDEFPLPLPRIVRIMSQVLAALDEAHAHGVIHRDLKPSNIMLIERRGQPDFVKVCDYGIAKAQLEDDSSESQMLTVQGLVCGTPEYMSPEQARGEPLDGRADLYSAAVILYHMVTGDIPFRAATPIDIVSRHLSETPVVPSARRPDPSIPPDLDDLILRGLAKSRELRPPTALMFREELENIGTGRSGRRARAADSTIPANQPLSGAGLAAAAPAAPAAAATRVKLHRANAWALAVVVAIALIAGAVVVVPRLAIGPGTGTPGAGGTTTLRTDPQARPRGTPSAPNDQAAAAAAPGSASTEVALAANAATAEATRDSTRTLAAARGVDTGGVAPSERGPGRRKRDTTGALGRGAAKPDGTEPVTAADRSVAPTAGGDRSMRWAGAPAMAADGQPAAASAEKNRPPGARDAREIIGEAETLLSHGEVGEACRRGEEAKQAAPQLAPVYKFLGKCYMRAGDPEHAKGNYRRYLELNPSAPDAMFIESIVK